MKFTKAKVSQMTAMFLCSAVLFCGCAKNDDIVIKINDHGITRSQFYSDFERLKNVQFKNSSREMKKDSSYAVIAFKEKYVNDVVMRELLTQEFEKRGIKVTEEEITAKQKKIIEQVGSEEQFKSILKENSISNDRLHSDLEQEVKMDKLVESLGIKDATDAEAQAFYNKNKAQFDMPERAQVSHILIETNIEALKRKLTDADKSAKLTREEISKKAQEEAAKKSELAKEVLKKAQANPKDFAKLAKEYSDDEASAQKGGDLGYITRDLVVKEFADAAFSQKIGVVGPIVKTQFGEHIILVKDRAAKGVQPFSEMKDNIKQYLSEQKKIEGVQKLVNGLKSNAKIEFIDESLNPKNLEKQLEESLKQQLELQQKNLEKKQEANKEKNLEKNEVKK